VIKVSASNFARSTWCIFDGLRVKSAKPVIGATKLDVVIAPKR